MEKQADLLSNLLTKIGLAPTSLGIDNISNFNNYRNWIANQLEHPNYYDDSLIKNYIKDFETENLNNFQLTLKYNSEPPPDQSAIMKECFTTRALYALYSENRLREMMVWFWFNHFNVYGDSGAFVYLKSYEDIFRENAFGNFKDILTKVIFNPALLTYSDNDLNTRPMTFNETEIGISDNFARIVLELHTLGDKGGHSESDIYELAKILSGLKSAEEYNFFFSDGSKIYINDLLKIKEKLEYENFFNNHPDFIITKIFNQYSIYFEEGHVIGDKTFLNNTIKNNSYNEIHEAINLIATHPNTAFNICDKLNLYFLGNDYDEKYSYELQKDFINSQGDIKKVLEKLLLSSEYEKHINNKNTFKNPYEFYFSTLKLLLNDQQINDLSFLETTLLNNNFGIHWKLTPEGYSLNNDDYITTNNLHHYINFIQFIINSKNTEAYGFNIVNNYYKLNEDKIGEFLISKDWIYK